MSHQGIQAYVPPLSILLPCRNAAAHLADCIASLQAQSYGDFDVFAVDDRSSDGTLELLEDWRSRDDRVHVLHGEGRGLVAALQRGLEATRAPRIARMDADDVAHPDRLSLQMLLLDAEQLSACGTRVRYFPSKDLKEGTLRYERWVNSLVTPDQIARDIFVECPIPHPTLVLTRASLDAVGGYRETGWPEDYDLILRLWAGGYRIGKVEETLLSWREGPARLSRTDLRYSEEAFRACKIHYLERTLLRERPPLVVCGAGPTGKTFARALLARGHHLRAFIELDRRKIGQTIHGAPVIDYGSLGPPNGAFALCAVAGDSARAEVRATLCHASWAEMQDFCAVA